MEKFEWEPQNNRFAVLTEDKEKRRNISFYNMYTMKGGNRLPEVNLLCKSHIHSLAFTFTHS